jgi:hypothetical protein
LVSTVPQVVISDASADELIGDNLVYLDMFPDKYWHSSGDEKRVGRRLVLNSNYADLVSGTTDIDTQQLQLKVADASFKELDGTPFDTNENDRYKKLCFEYLERQTLDVRSKIPFFIFEQLFSVDVKGLPLGDKVLAEIGSADSARVSELLALEVVDGLNRRSPEDARRLLEAEPDDEVPIISLLRSTTRKAIERLSSPTPTVFDNIFVEIIEAIKFFENEVSSDLSTSQLLVEVDNSTTEQGSPSIGLFSFL